MTGIVDSTVLWLTWRQLFARRRLWLALAFSLLPALLYSAIFICLGVTTKRALIAALVYVIVFEAMVTRSLEGVKSISVREFGLAIAQASSSGGIKFSEYVVPLATVWIVGGIFLAG